MERARFSEKLITTNKPTHLTSYRRKLKSLLWTSWKAQFSCRFSLVFYLTTLSTAMNA